MKIEKFERLLNKVVELNRPNDVYCKGFLYKNNNGYYLKLVEDYGDLRNKQAFFLKEGDVEFVSQADKPKLMRISLKSWHYRLLKFVLRDKTPTPKTMQNGCPYFWLLVFSLFACPFVVLGKFLVFLISLLPVAFVWCLEKAFDLWIKSLEDAAACDLADKSRYSYSYKKRLPLTVRTYFNMTTELSSDEFLDYFLLEKYKLSPDSNSDEYKRKKRELSEKWLAWREEIRLENERREKVAYEYRMKEQQRIREWERKAEIRQARWEARMKPFKEGINNIFNSINKAFTFDVKFDWKFIIKRTKQVVGAVITMVLLALTYFFVNVFAFCLMVMADWSIEHWYVFAVIGCIAVLAGVVYILFIFITGWVQSIVDKYRRGRKIWFVEPFIYLLYYPVKYIIIVIAYGLFYVIWKPIEYIFYRFLWNLVIVPFAGLIWKLICALGRGLANSTGVFGEYFSASYTDYCPGIEWVDVESEMKDTEEYIKD